MPKADSCAASVGFVTDHTTQTLDRDWKATGSLEARVRLLRAWGREGRETPLECKWCKAASICLGVDAEGCVVGCGCNGTGRAPWSAALELGAYLGDEACRELVGWCCRLHAKYASAKTLAPCVTGETAMHNWLSGLERWSVTLRAAVAVGWAAWRAQCRCGSPGEGDGSSAEHYEPCQLARNALGVAQRYLDDPSEANQWSLDEWDNSQDHVRMPAWAWHVVQEALCEHGDAEGHDHFGAVATHCGLTDTQIRTTVRNALVPWALEEARILGEDV